MTEQFTTLLSQRPPASDDDRIVELLYTEDEEALRRVVREWLERTTDQQSLPGFADAPRTDAVAWATLTGELGLAALLVPEARGGAGATAAEAAVVLEELGAAGVAVPFLTSAVVATRVALAGDDDGLLADLASGTTTAALVVPFDAFAPSGVPHLESSSAGITGTVRNVAGALEAAVLLVPVAAASGRLEIHAVTVTAASITPVLSLDMTRQLADVSFVDAESRLVVQSDRADAALADALMYGAGLIVSEQLGLARWCFETTLAYLKNRRQFGRQIGSFQALKHRAADLYVRINGLQSAARYAAASLAAGRHDAQIAVSVSKSFASDAALFVAEDCLQLHGGIGMTWEHPLHIYLKRAKADSLAFGSAGTHRMHLAVLVDLEI